MSERDAYDADQEQLMEDIREETEDYADNLQRSEEDGWFYADDDVEDDNDAEEWE